ncbi:hypothetical protein [Thiocapsa sp. UBA6158]|jgi:phospholipase A1|uniref:hypothetical protein n=1 Tax=Thiocapsa sp. UBA6158 TaxID=1947692 RepID=UPI0025EA7B7B|nr:hypothetical protein [Thiocapsa sp. UBA6158]
MLFQQLKWLGATALMAAMLTQVVPARADTPSPSIAECAAIQTDQARLACDDRASGRLPVVAQTSGGTIPERTAMSAPAAPLTVADTPSALESRTPA